MRSGLKVRVVDGLRPGYSPWTSCGSFPRGAGSLDGLQRVETASPLPSPSPKTDPNGTPPRPPRGSRTLSDCRSRASARPLAAPGFNRLTRAPPPAGAVQAIATLILERSVGGHTGACRISRGSPLILINSTFKAKRLQLANEHAPTIRISKHTRVCFV